MNVLYVEMNLQPWNGGVERTTWVNSQQLRTYRIKVFYAYTMEDWNGIPHEEKVNLNFKEGKYIFVQTFCDYIKRNRIDVIINQGLTNKELIYAYKEAIEIYGVKLINVVHVNPNYYYFTPIPLKWKIKNKLQYILTGLDPRVKGYNKLYDIADATVVLSKSYFNDFIKNYRLKNGNKLYAIPNPLSFKKSLDKDKIATKKKQVIIISRMWDFEKNISGALRIWKKVEDLGCGEWDLILGGYGQDEDKLLKYASELGLLKFKFVGKVSNTQERFAESSIFMLTSNIEGFGMTLTEAMQEGCVPLAFNTYSAVNDIIDNGINGFVIDKGEEDVYAEKIKYLIDNDEIRIKMSYEALKSSEKFQEKKIGQQWVKLLKKIAQ